MKRTSLIAAMFIATASMAIVAVSIAVADTSKEQAAGGQPEFKLPEGWTVEDMQACMLAATPSKMHAHLEQGVGMWQGKNTMWMAPGAEPMQSESVTTVTAMMDGRFIKSEMKGDMPGMGPFDGFRIDGFDNVSQKFVSIWIDNHSTGIGTGEGESSSNGKIMTWEYTFNCPITKKPALLREVATITGPNTKTVEMFNTDPKSGKEYKMMHLELTKK